MNYTIVELIQSMLAPGIMISACGLLLLGMNNRYSLVISRMRLLNEERRKLNVLRQEKNLSENETIRFNSLLHQIGMFKHRLRLVRNAVLCYSLAVAFFILSSLLIGLRLAVFSDLMEYFIVIPFLLGMLTVFAGVTFAAREIRDGYKIIHIELNEV